MKNKIAVAIGLVLIFGAVFYSLQNGWGEFAEEAPLGCTDSIFIVDRDIHPGCTDNIFIAKRDTLIHIEPQCPNCGSTKLYKQPRFPGGYFLGKMLWWHTAEGGGNDSRLHVYICGNCGTVYVPMRGER